MGIAGSGTDLWDFKLVGWSVSLKSSLAVDEHGEELRDSRETRLSVSREWVPMGMIVIGCRWNAASCRLASSSSSVTEMSTSLSSSTSSVFESLTCVVVVELSAALLLASSSLFVFRHFALLFLNHTYNTGRIQIRIVVKLCIFQKYLFRIRGTGDRLRLTETEIGNKCNIYLTNFPNTDDLPNIY